MFVSGTRYHIISYQPLTYFCPKKDKNPNKINTHWVRIVGTAQASASALTSPPTALDSASSQADVSSSITSSAEAVGQWLPCRLGVLHPPPPLPLPGVATVLCHPRPGVATVLCHPLEIRVGVPGTVGASFSGFSYNSSGV